jgi:hypothetical protein
LIGETKADVVLLDCDEVAGGDAKRSDWCEISSIPILALSVCGDEDADGDALTAARMTIFRNLRHQGAAGARQECATPAGGRAGETGAARRPDLEIDLIHRRVRSGGRRYTRQEAIRGVEGSAEAADRVISHENIATRCLG